MFILRAETLSDPLWIKKKNNSYCKWNETLHSYAIWGWQLVQGKGGSVVILSSQAGRGGDAQGWGEQDTEQGTAEPCGRGDVVTHTVTCAVWLPMSGCLTVLPVQEAFP